MSSFPRYAIYYLPPPDSTLAQFGAAMLGYDVVNGVDVAFSAAVKSIPDWREITADPRRYGFHATLKAPFALAAGRSESELLWACTSFAETPRLLPTIGPVVRPISHFIALVPEVPSQPLTALAADCVRDFDGFRAPLSPEDRARRKPARLPPRQVEYLDRWGYPYVMDEFRFHMTLTGALEQDRLEAIARVLRPCLADLSLSAITIDRFAVLCQSGPEHRFTCIAQFVLREHTERACNEETAAVLRKEKPR